MSAFIRRQPVRTVDLGTRPGLHGQVLISTGLAGMDKLLGGGLPLGTILLLIEDSNSQQHNNILKYFMAEGVCCKHTVAWVSADTLTPEGVAAFLPSTAKLQGADVQQQVAKQSRSSSVQKTAAAAAAAATATGVPAGSQAAEPDDGLKIAWQYRKYIQHAEATPSVPQRPIAQISHSSSRAISGSSSFSRTSSTSTNSSGGSSSSSSTAAKNLAAGIGREWCHQYDLTKGMTPAQLQGSKFETYCCQSQDGSAVTAADAAVPFVQRFQPAGPIPVPSRDPASVGRLVIQSLGGPAWWPTSSSSSSSSSSLADVEAALLAAVADLRLQIQDATCAAVISCPAGLYSESFQARLQHLADAVLCIQCLADNSDVYKLLPDPTSASALLEVRRLPALGLLQQRIIEERLYLIRHKRRSISVSVLDLLPLEALEASAGLQQQQAVDVPAAAKICGGGPGKSSVLDF